MAQSRLTTQTPLLYDKMTLFSIGLCSYLSLSGNKTKRAMGAPGCVIEL